jgi:hypothetical protein
LAHNQTAPHYAYIEQEKACIVAASLLDAEKVANREACGLAKELKGEEAKKHLKIIK